MSDSTSTSSSSSSKSVSSSSSSSSSRSSSSAASSREKKEAKGKLRGKVTEVEEVKIDLGSVADKKDQAREEISSSSTSSSTSERELAESGKAVKAPKKGKGKEQEKKRPNVAEDTAAAIVAKRQLLKESQELDLVNLDVVVVEDSDSSGDEKAPDSALENPTLSDGKTNLFDTVPDEIVFHIFSKLNEEEMLRNAQVCRRFLDLQNEPMAWEDKTDQWTNLRVSRPTAGNDPHVRDYYVGKYREHLRIAEVKLQNEKQQRRQQLRDKQIDQVDFVMKWAFMNRFAAEWLWLVCWTLYSVLLALQLDNIIRVNWHVIHIPLYVCLSYSAFAILLWRFFYIYYDKYVTWSYGKRVMQGNSVMQIFADVHHLIFYGLVVWTLFAFLAFFIILAEAKNSSTGIFDTWPSILVLGIGCVGFGFAFIHGLGERLIFKGDNWWRWFLFLPLLYFFWQVLFVWLKAENYVRFNWYAALSPLWMVLIAAFFGVFFGVGYAWLDSFADERIVISIIWVGLMVTVSGLSSWLGLVAFNLEREVYNEKMFAWTIVFTPLYIVEGIGFFACGGFDIWYHFFK